MRNVQITDRRRTSASCPTVFEGNVVVDGITETFHAYYRQGKLTLTTASVDIEVPVELNSDRTCTWPEIKDPILDAMDAHFNSADYAERRQRVWAEAA